MMEENKKIKTATTSHSGLPSLLIDKSGRIIALSTEVKKILSIASAQANFFELFDEQKLLTLQRIFIDARKYEYTAKDVLSLESGSETKNYEVTFSPLRSENNIYFLITFRNISEKSSENEANKFWVSVSDLEKITNDKKIISIVNKIKLTYPFTFIEKAKIQKEINELENYFWIKEADGKFIVVNDAYSESLGFKSNQIENRSESDFLPKYLIFLYETIDNFIKETTNTVIFQGIATPVASGLVRDLKIVEFPICDLDNKVVAIIGFSQKTNGDAEISDFSASPVIKNIPLPILILNEELKIKSYSNSLVKLMLLNDKIDYSNYEITKLFDKNLCNEISNYVNGDSNKSEYSITYQFEEKVNLQSEVNLTKLFDEYNNYVGLQIVFVPKSEVQLELEAKAQLYDSFVLNSPEAIFVYDLENLKFLEVNDAALKLYGYKRNDFLNMDLTDLYAPEDIQTLISTSDKNVSAGLGGPWRHKKRDGTSILVEINRSSINYLGRNAHLNIVKDVTNEAENKKKIQLFQTLYENSSDLIIITDKDGFISEDNKNVNTILGYSKKDLEGRPFISLVIDDDRALVNKTIFHSGLHKTTSVEAKVKKPSGSSQKSNIIATPIKNYQGEIESFVIMIHLFEERTDSKDINQPQEGVVEKIDPPFLSNVFHELLTPINVILGFTQELGESLEEPSHEQKEAIDIIKENQKLLLQIMDNAVEFSTLHQKIVKFKPEQIVFVDVLEELKENIKKTADSKKVEFTLGKISSSLALESDKQKFLSLLSLFLKFAIQITKENSIYLSAYNINDESVAVAVKDSKNEITSYLVKGFNDVFSNEESLGRRNYGFSRFSIRLANKLIELLSVKKQVIQKDNKAIEFALVFPNKFVANVENFEVEETENEIAIVNTKPVMGEPQTIQKPTKGLELAQLSCLYLEDQVDSQILFKTQMKDLKSIEFAPSFETALPLLKTKRFDFIVMDINLQGEYNGLDALRIIRKMPGYKDIPIIASTAYVQSGAQNNFKAAGFTEFISKPLLREKILETLRLIFQ